MPATAASQYAPTRAYIRGSVSTGPFRAICQEVAEKDYEGLVLTRH
jgi:hypothetical protein